VNEFGLFIKKNGVKRPTILGLLLFIIAVLSPPAVGYYIGLGINMGPNGYTQANLGYLTYIIYHNEGWFYGLFVGAIISWIIGPIYGWLVGIKLRSLISGLIIGAILGMVFGALFIYIYEQEMGIGLAIGGSSGMFIWGLGNSYNGYRKNKRQL